MPVIIFACLLLLLRTTSHRVGSFCLLPCSHLGQSTDPTKRSINLALSHRGRSALAAAGVEERVLRECVRMPCRAIHDRSGHITTQPYGTGDQAIFSASRSLLNRVVLEQCEAAGSSAASSSSSSSSGAGAGAGAAGSRPRGTVSIYFEYGLKTLDAQGNAVFENTRTKDTRAVAAALVVGADGAYSAVRERMLRLARLSYSREYIAHGYKELNMAPVPVKAAGYAGAGAASGGAGAASAACGEAETWAMPVAEALHIWPRDGHMLIALPNPDKTFTCTLFLPWEQLDALDADPAAAKAWFGANFPDALPLIADFETQFARNPSSALVMTKCDPWVVGDRVTLIGDAAHSVVPFYGQGANAAFEDCLFFVECLDACAGDLSAAVRKYAKERKPAGDALAKLSLDNYVEMRAKTASAAFLLRKRFEAGLHWLAPSSWIPQYTMVAFTVSQRGTAANGFCLHVAQQ